jgi:hypothetical protein
LGRWRLVVVSLFASDCVFLFDPELFSSAHVVWFG